MCSNWKNFDIKMNHLLKFFTQDGYGAGFFSKLLNEYLTNIFRPKLLVSTVAKEKNYVTMPFLGFKQEQFSKQLRQILNKFYK